MGEASGHIRMRLCPPNVAHPLLPGGAGREPFSENDELVRCPPMHTTSTSLRKLRTIVVWGGPLTLAVIFFALVARKTYKGPQVSATHRL